MKSLKILWRVVAEDLATRCCTSATRDYQTVSRRFEHEGLSFLTISLPAFGKDFERSLELQQVDSSLFHGFHRTKGPLPSFLGGFLSQVFDSGTGRLLDIPNVDCIFAVRQLTLMFKKILLDCSSERLEDAARRYVECEKEVRQVALSTPEEARVDFRKAAACLFEDVFNDVANATFNGVLVPRHGPGQTADRLLGNEKFDQLEWPDRLERTFPFGEYALANWRYYYQLEHVRFLEPWEERPVKVVFVPKTLKTPRVIAMEPTCMQYMQQALANRFVEALESDIVPGHNRHNIVQGLIGFTDQDPNKILARSGSVTRLTSTIDLAEASDRVSTQHVVDLLSRWPLLQEAVFATRSTKAEVPGYGTMSLAKFASMGSALCFPIESMVFLTVVFIGIAKELNLPVSRRLISRFRGQVRVYGDDIIVPTDYVRSVIDTLELYGFKVNVGKTFWNGKFRESCGGDFYDGEDVKPVYVRRKLPTSRTDVSEVRSLVSFRNQLYLVGLWASAKYLDSIIGHVLPHFPIVEPSSPALGRTSLSFSYEGERDCPHLHRPLVRAYVSVSDPPPSRVSGEGALLKCLLKQGDQPFADRRHLERQGRPSTVGIKLRWVPPF